MTAMDFPTSPTNGQTSGNYYFDSSVGSGGAWRANPIPVGGLPAGSIIQWGSATAPTNWLICDGSAVSRTVYASLFSVIGTTYGTGDNSTTFNLPDLRGRVPVGKNGGTFGTLGSTGGAETHTLTIAEMPAHGHDGAVGFPISYGTTGDRVQLGSPGYPLDVTPNLTGGGGAHNNLQPYQVVNYIIKATTGWTAGDSELAGRINAIEFSDKTFTGVKTFSNNITAPNLGSYLIAQQTFTNTTNITFQNCFSATYSSYMIVIDSMNQTAAGSGIYMRMGNTVGGVYTANSSAQYGYRGLLVGASVGLYNSDSAVNFLVGTTTAGNRYGTVINIQSPFITPSQTTLQCTWQENYNNIGWFMTETLSNDASYNSFNLFVNSGTFYGTVKVYGLA